jgi:hypothetical protein
MNDHGESILNIQYQWTIKELEDAYKCETQSTVRPVFLYNIYLISACYLLAAMINCYLESFSRGSAFFLALSFSFAVSTLIAFNPTLRATTHFKKMHDENAILSWVINRDGLRCYVKGEIKHDLVWSNIIRLVQSPKGSLVYSTPRIFYWLPKHAFPTENDYALFLLMASTAISEQSGVA